MVLARCLLDIECRRTHLVSFRLTVPCRLRQRTAQYVFSSTSRASKIASNAFAVTKALTVYPKQKPSPNSGALCILLVIVTFVARLARCLPDRSLFGGFGNRLLHLGHALGDRSIFVGTTLVTRTVWQQDRFTLWACGHRDRLQRVMRAATTDFRSGAAE